MSVDFDAGIHELGSGIFGLEEGRTGTVTVKTHHKVLKKPGDIVKTKALICPRTGMPTG